MDEVIELLTKRAPYNRRIETEAHISKPIYDHLRPVLNYALDKGCRFTKTTHSLPFSSTPNGEYCEMEGPLTMAQLKEVFDFPETIEITSGNRECLWDKKNNITLCIIANAEGSKS